MPRMMKLSAAVVAATLIALAAVNGAAQTRTPPGTQAWRTANWHMAIMLVMSTIVAVNILLRLSFWSANTRYPDNPILITSLIIGALVAFGSIYGGSMVYDYAFNVEGDFDHAYEKSEHDRIPGRSEPS